MTELIRDTAFGHLVRFVTRGKYLKFAEEADPTVWTRYIDEKKSAYLAHHGSTDPPEDPDDMPPIEGIRTREAQYSHFPPPRLARLASSRSQRTSSQEPINEVSGVPVDSEKGRDIHLVTWYGDDDPENPRNWSLFKRVFVTFEICLLTTSVYIGSSIYSAGTDNVAEIFGVSKVAATLGLTLFVAGYGTGPMIFAPMSEIPQIGRNPIYLATLAVFVAFQAPTALSTNFGMLCAFRFLTGFFGSPVLATGGATLADIWRPSKRAYAMSIWGIAAVSGPTLGPLVGGFAVQYGFVEGGFTAPWTWPIWELMWLSGFCLVFLFFFLPETSANNILVRRTKRLRKITGDDKLKCEAELMSEEMTGYDIVMMSLVRPFTLNFLEPMVSSHSHINLQHSPLTLIPGFHAQPLHRPHLWPALHLVRVVRRRLHRRLPLRAGPRRPCLPRTLHRHPPRHSPLLHLPQVQSGAAIRQERGNPAGEAPPARLCRRLLHPNVSSPKCCPPARRSGLTHQSHSCLFWFGWTAMPQIHWIVPIIGSAWFGIGAFLLFNSVLNYLPDAYPENAASVLAGNDLFRSSFGAGFPLFASAMYSNLGIGWASSTLGFISLAFIPIPFVLYKVCSSSSPFDRAMLMCGFSMARLCARITARSRGRTCEGTVLRQELERIKKEYNRIHNRSGWMDFEAATG